MTYVASVRPSRWMLEAPKLQLVGETAHAVRAVFCQSSGKTGARISYIEIRTDGYFWLATPEGSLIRDPFEVVPLHLQHNAEIALWDWLAWRRVT